MGHKVYTKHCVKNMAAPRSSSRGGITFEELFKALVAFLRVEQKGTIKNIVVLQKDAL